MKKAVSELARDIDFSTAKRGAVIAPEAGKIKVSIRLDHAVVDYFRDLVDANGGGNYQMLINNALVAHIQQQAMLDAVRQVVREELAQEKTKSVRTAKRSVATK
jgi:uncharacterized protein (DUF4415 family)